MPIVLPDERGIFSQLKWGFQVRKASVLSGDDDLFDVYGQVLITLMFGEMTTAMGGSGTVAINEQASSIPIVKATTIDNDIIGTMYLVSGQADAELNGGLTNPVAVIASLTADHETAVDDVAVHSPILFSGGSSGLVIESTQTGTDASGEIEWTICYFPLNELGRITAAA